MTRFSPRLRFRQLARTAVLGLAPAPAMLSAQQPPPSGQAVLERMHEAYKDTWYRTLTFVQTTTIDRGNGPVEQTWYETLASPSILRIDIGAPADGNGLLYTVDSLVVLRGGKVVRRTADGNPFLPLIQGVYVQPVEQTAREVAGFKVDLSRTMTARHGDSLAWVVGTSTPGDTLSPQFWVDPTRLVVTRFIINASPNLRIDAALGGYVPVGKAWLATEVTMTLPSGSQRESYHDWHAGVMLPDGFFDPARWLEVKHWAVPTPAAARRSATSPEPNA